MFGNNDVSLFQYMIWLEEIELCYKTRIGYTVRRFEYTRSNGYLIHCKNNHFDNLLQVSNDYNDFITKSSL